ncbi:MAG: hypothetical protein AABX16_01905 [Nanoarchaeota archaeon]
MNKKIFLFTFVFLFFIVGITIVSAGICKTSRGYYQDCDGNTYSYENYYQFRDDSSSYDYNKYHSYNSYNAYQYVEKPIFKGSYGNYRYEKYLNGDDNPSTWFTGFGTGYYNYPVFGGGYYNYGNYGGYGYGYGYSSYGGLFGSNWFWY